jgi:hypothetical protein
VGDEWPIVGVEAIPRKGVLVAEVSGYTPLDEFEVVPDEQKQQERQRRQGPRTRISRMIDEVLFQTGTTSTAPLPQFGHLLDRLWPLGSQR